ncbi:MAG: hypothetical protein AAFO82_21990 [Bacteroidota bacterium]
MKELKHAKIYKTELSNLEELQAILTPHKILLDTKYLLLMEQVEEGDIASALELMEYFFYGTNAIQPNYELTTRFAYKALEITEKQENNTIALLEAYCNLIKVEGKFGKYEKSKQLMKDALELTVEYFNYDEVYGYIHQAFCTIVDNASYEDELEESIE